MNLYQSAWTDGRKNINIRQNRPQVVNKVAEKTMPKLYQEIGCSQREKYKLLSTNKINYYLTEELLNKLSTMSETGIQVFTKDCQKYSQGKRGQITK